MVGTYASFVNSAVGRKLAAQLGLPRPARLRRYDVGAPLLDGPVLVGGHRDALAGRARDLLAGEGSRSWGRRSPKAGSPASSPTSPR